MRFDVGPVRLSALLLLAIFFGENATAAPGDLLSTDRTNVNVRSTPSTNAGIVTRIGPGETVIEVDSLRDWYRVRLPDQNREGWVFAPLLSAVTNPGPEPSPALEPAPLQVQPTAEAAGRPPEKALSPADRLLRAARPVR